MSNMENFRDDQQYLHKYVGGDLQEEHPCDCFPAQSLLLLPNSPSSKQLLHTFTSTTDLRPAPMSGNRGKRKFISEPDIHSTTETNLNRSPNKVKKEKTVKTKQTTPPLQTLTSSPPKTPKTPGGASKLGLKKETTKCLLRHGSKIGPLCDVLHGFARLVLAKKLTTEEEIKPLFDEIAGQLVKHSFNP